MASVGRDALTKCGVIMKRARTYRARADECGAGAGRVVTTGPHRATTGPHCPTTGLQRVTTDRQLTTTGPQRVMTGTGVKKRNGRRRVCNARRRVQGRATTGAASCDDGGDRATTGRGSGDDGSRIGQRRVRPRADTSRPQYIREAD